MTKLCKCGHKKTDHYPRGLELTLGRANQWDVTRCHAYVPYRLGKEIGECCDCLEFSGV